LEIGCGLGLPGIAALAKGRRVTFSDYDSTALHFAAGNARLNGFDNFDVLHMNWRRPPAGLQFPFVVASEPIYVLDQVEALADFIHRVVEPGGCFLMSDQERLQAEALRGALEARRMVCHTTVASVLDFDYYPTCELKGLVTWVRHKT
jgi:16S rRNA G1207 methylase RsmC